MAFKLNSNERLIILRPGNRSFILERLEWNYKNGSKKLVLNVFINFT